MIEHLPRFVPTLCLLALSSSLHAAVAVPEASEKAMSYYYTGNVLWAIGIAVGLFVPALFLFTGWSAKIRDLARRVSPRWSLTLLAYLVIYGAITFALQLPLIYYQGFVVEHQFGLSNQSLSKWAADTVIGLGVETVIAFLVLLGVYRMLKISPQRWWLYTGLAAVPFVLFMIMVAPVWIDPLFNKYGPMKDRALEAKILALADKAGIEGGRVFEVEKSVDTKKTNASVSGFMGTERIVLWDTVIREMDEPELLGVMAHEMGHYVLGHTWKSVPMFCALIMLALYGAHRLSQGLIERYKARFGFDRLDDIASWPLITLVASMVFVVVSPAQRAFSRYIEHEADRFELELTRNNEASATSFVKAQVDNLGNPRPNALLHLLRDDHPTLAERIEFANTYKPWEKGEPLVYGELFRK